MASKFVVKNVSFKEEDDRDILEFLADKKFSKYVKDLIRQDMNSDKTVINTDTLSVLTGLLQGGIAVPQTAPQPTPQPTVDVEELKAQLRAELKEEEEKKKAGKKAAKNILSGLI